MKYPLSAVLPDPVDPEHHRGEAAERGTQLADLLLALGGSDEEVGGLLEGTDLVDERL